MAVISFRFRVSIRSEKYSNHSAVRLHRSEFETTLNPRKTGISETDTLPKEVFRQNAKTQAKQTFPRRLPQSDKRHRLNSHNIEALPAPYILAPHRVIAANHVALRLGKTSPVAVIGPSRQLRLLSPHHPVNLILALLPAVRTRHHVRPLLRPLIKKVPL